MTPYRFAGQPLDSPLLLASGTFGFGIEALEGGFCPEGLGAIVMKGLSYEARLGAPQPRLAEVGSGVVLNAIGLENPGVQVFLDGIYPRLGSYKQKIVINVFGSTRDEYVRVISAVVESSAVGLCPDVLLGFELNLSCPNTDKGGLEFLEDQTALPSLLESCVEAAHGFGVVAKVSPAARIDKDFLSLFVRSKVCGLTLGNTLAVSSLVNGSFVLGRKQGGQSGPTLRARTLRMIQMARDLGYDGEISACGGMTSLSDVNDAIASGASSVQLGTVNLANPWAAQEIFRKLPDKSASPSQ